MANECGEQTFGPALRSLRLAGGLTLRGMARKIGVTPTYLSCIERDKGSMPTEARIRQMGGVLKLPQGQMDRLFALAGRVPQDLRDVLRGHPHEIASLLRAARGLDAGTIRRLTAEAKAEERKRHERLVGGLNYD